MKKKLGTIYILRNKINGKCYVGQTVDWNSRYSNHINNKKNDMYIDKSIKKNGINNFSIFLCKDIPIKFLDQFEINMIQKLNTLVPNGYNLESGGNKNKKQHEETKKKISISHIGTKAYQIKKIICLNTLEVFDYIKQVTEKYNISDAHIGQVCKNQRYYAGLNYKNEKLTWAYYEDYLKMTEQEIKNKIEKAQKCRKGINTYKRSQNTKNKISKNRKGQCIGKNNPMAKSIICLETKEIFDTTSEAGQIKNINRNNITNCLTKRSNSAGKDLNGNKLHWMYYSEYLELNKKELIHKEG